MSSFRDSFRSVGFHMTFAAIASLKQQSRWLPSLGLALVCLSVLGGCRTMGPSSAKLSAEIGARLAEMEGLHQLAIQSYFDSEKRRIEEFLDEEWEPLFLRNFLGTSAILADLSGPSRFVAVDSVDLHLTVALYLADDSEAGQLTSRLLQTLNESRQTEPEQVQQILNEFIEDRQLPAARAHVSALLGTDEPARMILDFADAAHEQMKLQRKTLLDPLEKARTKTMSEIASVYNELLTAQGTITGRLEAAAKVTAEQDRLFDSLVGEGKAEALRGKLSSFSEKIGGALQSAKDALADVEGGRNDASGVIRDLREALDVILDPSDNSKEGDSVE